MAENHVSGHGSADDEYLATPEGSTYEHTDAHTGIIIKFVFWLVVMAVVVHLGLGVMYSWLISDAETAEAADVRYPLAEGEEPRLPPVPRLQQYPAAELGVFRRDEDALLGSYGWQNREAGVVHIPIAEAMRLTVERGLLSRGGEGDTPTVTPGMIPADSSSGRTLERRRQ